MRSSVCGNAYHPLVIYALDPIDNTFNSIQRQLRDVSPNGFGKKLDFINVGLDTHGQRERLPIRSEFL